MSILLMFDIGGLAVSPMLDAWLASEAPQSTVHYVDTTYWDFWEKQDYQNAFATDRPALRQEIREWMLDPAHRRRFADKVLKPDFLDLAALQPGTGCIEFGTMVNAVFDHLTQ